MVSKSDKISLSITDLNFSKKQRWKKSAEASNGKPNKLTRRQCASKVAQIFDLVGRIAPLFAAMKHDLQVLSQRQLDWDDVLPDDLWQLWVSNFDFEQLSQRMLHHWTLIRWTSVMSVSHSSVFVSTHVSVGKMESTHVNWFCQEQEL